MAITMRVNDDPTATTGATVGFSVAAVLFTAGAVLLCRTLFESPQKAQSGD